jgi:Raf kinase inhibitor-like YbhB/YbcL family protein
VGPCPTASAPPRHAFADDATIPERYTCDGENLSPSLFWEEPPEGTVSFALTMVDPDAPGGLFVHWVYFDIPGEARSLPEAIETAEESDPLRECLGDHVFESLLKNKKLEWAEYRAHVSDFELKRYLPIL